MNYKQNLVFLWMHIRRIYTESLNFFVSFIPLEIWLFPENTKKGSFYKMKCKYPADRPFTHWSIKWLVTNDLLSENKKNYIVTSYRQSCHSLFLSITWTKKMSIKYNDLIFTSWFRDKISLLIVTNNSNNLWMELLKLKKMCVILTTPFLVLVFPSNLMTPKWKFLLMRSFASLPKSPNFAGAILISE